MKAISFDLCTLSNKWNEVHSWCSVATNNKQWMIGINKAHFYLWQRHVMTSFITDNMSLWPTMLNIISRGRKIMKSMLISLELMRALPLWKTLTLNLWHNGITMWRDKSNIAAFIGSIEIIGLCYDRSLQNYDSFFCIKIIQRVSRPMMRR